MSQDGGTFAPGDTFRRFFKRGADFTKTLLEENERLRRELAAFEAQQGAAVRNPDPWEGPRGQLLAEIRILEAERDLAVEGLRDARKQNREFAQRHREIEEENNALANLCVASFQLHSTLDPSEVLAIIIEIASNLIGAEKFAVFALNERNSQLEAVVAEGGDPEVYPKIPMGCGIIGECVVSGQSFCGDTDPSEDLQRPIACIPLRVQDQAIGAIAIYKLLQQKERFTPLDQELFTLLAGHAATALFASRLYAHSEHKLTTIQGFIDLLIK